jgi:hypothetical protein
LRERRSPLRERRTARTSRTIATLEIG